jgi:amidase
VPAPSALTVAAQLRARATSAVELVSAQLAELDRVDGLNAVAWRHDELVLAQAEAADRALAAGEPIGPLHGVPITVKDWIDVTGFPCAAGDPASRDRRPSQDASAVARLRAAGGVVIAKTNAGERNRLHGPARNPWDVGHTPGYSSAGEAALVAAGASVLGLGSDSGGSLRFPAHCCGIATLRPTYGRVPSTGHFPVVGQLSDARTVIGPLATTVADLRLALDVIAGPDGRDPAVAPLPPAGPADLAGVRVAVERGGATGPLPTRVLEAVDAAARALAEAGARVEEAAILQPARALDITQRYWDRSRLGGAEAERLLEDWDRFREHAMSRLDRFDVVLSPAAPHPAPRLGSASDDDWMFTLTASLWGWPAAVVRAGTSDEGLPLGVQLMAGPWRDDRCLAAAEQVETALGPWPLAPPLVPENLRGAGVSVEVARDADRTDLLDRRLRALGEVFATFRDQDSGGASFGVEVGGRRLFVKGAVEPRAEPSLRRAVAVHRAVRHPAVVPLLGELAADGVPALVYPWVDGEVLYGPRGGATARCDPSSAHARFRRLPVPEVLAAVERIFAAHLVVADRGYVAVDLYDGCFLYDADRHEMHLCDLDEYRPGPFVLDEDRLPGSERFMAPEERRRGALIDERTTVHALGRSALVLLDAGDLDGGFRGPAAARAVAERATRAEPEDRYPTVAELVAAWHSATGAP